MTELDDDANALFAAARGADAPQVADRERVRAKLLLSLGAGGAAALGAGKAAASAGTSLAAGGTSLGAGTSLAAGAGTSLGAGAAGTASTAAGLAAGTSTTLAVGTGSALAMKIVAAVAVVSAVGFGGAAIVESNRAPLAVAPSSTTSTPISLGNAASSAPREGARAANDGPSPEPATVAPSVAEAPAKIETVITPARTSTPESAAPKLAVAPVVPAALAAAPGHPPSATPVVAGNATSTKGTEPLAAVAVEPAKPQPSPAKPEPLVGVPGPAKPEPLSGVPSPAKPAGSARGQIAVEPGTGQSAVDFA